MTAYLDVPHIDPAEVILSQSGTKLPNLFSPGGDHRDLFLLQEGHFTQQRFDELDDLVNLADIVPGLFSKRCTTEG